MGARPGLPDALTGLGVQFAQSAIVGPWIYARSMSGLPVHEPALPPLPPVGASPREVRAALHPEYRADFDRDYRAALDEAAVSLELGGVQEVVEHWRMRCYVTRDKQDHRRMVRKAVELLTGEVPPEDEPTEVTESRL